MTYSPERAVAELRAQHDLLRGMMDQCEELADALDAGSQGFTQLTRQVARLRLAFEAHNKFEEQLLRPVLFGAHAAHVIEHLFEDHVQDHRAMRKQLATTETTGLREVIASMRRHLDAEERYLLAAGTLAVAAGE